MTDARVPLVLDTQFVKQQRAAGGVIWVLDQTGRSWHMDDEVRQIVGDVSHVAAVSDEHASDLRRLMKRHFGQRIKAWLPFGSDWYRAEVYWINVFVVLAIWPEVDASKHHIHVA